MLQSARELDLERVIHFFLSIAHVPIDFNRTCVGLISSYWRSFDTHFCHKTI